MPIPSTTSSGSLCSLPESRPVWFEAEGSTCQKAALYVYKATWAEVRWEGEEFVYGNIYSFPYALKPAITNSLAIEGTGRFSRVQNLAHLQKNLSGKRAHFRVEEIASGLIDQMNSEIATEESLMLSAKLIAMQFQLAGVPLGREYLSRPNRVHKLKERIDTNGCFESIGNRPLAATLLFGTNGRPAVLEKRVRFMEACQSEAQKKLAEQIQQFGETSTLTSAEDLIHRAKLTLVAAPTDYLRPRFELANKICDQITNIEFIRRRDFHADTAPPSRSEVYSGMTTRIGAFQNPCNTIRLALVEFGNPIPVNKPNKAYSMF